MTGARLHGYEILKEIGVGGMSRVFLANDLRNQPQVAIKLLPAEYLNDLGFRARFEQEAHLIAALKHEAIVPVYEYGVYQGQPFIVMQYMPKGSLADRLSLGPLSPDQAAKVLGRLSGALNFAHRQGIIHRDLKPSNILYDQDDNIFLADFGIALHNESTWQRDLASGTPGYMSPEQALREKNIGLRSDIYSLGIIAFEMLTGGLPFDGNLPVTVLLKHVHDPPPSLGAVNPDLPAALDPVLQRALEKDPEDRYQSAEDFFNAFEGALHQGFGKPLVVEYKENEVSDQQNRIVSADAGDEASLEEMALPAKSPNKRVFPDFSNFSAKRSGLRPEPRPGYYFYAVGLVTWVAVLFAAMTAVIARAQELFPTSNVEIIFDESAFAVVNQSSKTIDLSGVVFQRISGQGDVTAAFPADQWDRITPGVLSGIPAGDCFQLLRYGSNNYSLVPGTVPAKPPACKASQGWLVATDQAWHFWTVEGEGARFQIVRQGQSIHECRIADGVCDFYLPENNARSSQ